MSTAPRVDIALAEFWRDPYPMLARLRREAPIALIPQLGGTVFTKRDDIFICEKRIDVFSSHQPNGLMNKLMGHNMMRKDGPEHMAERATIFPSVSPKVARNSWRTQFQEHADRLLAGLAPGDAFDFCSAFALPFSAECLKSVTGLTQIHFQDMNDWSQAMIDGIANYAGDPKIEAACNAAAANIDAAIDERLPALRRTPDLSLLGVMLAADVPTASVRANIKLAISGGQNEPRDAITGTVWALLAHPDQLALALRGEASWLMAFEEYARWIAPIGMSPRRVARPWTFRDVDFDAEDRVFFMFGSANRDESCFTRPDEFDIRRDTSKGVTFGAGPHFCAGAFVARTMIADVALPTIFQRLPQLRLSEPELIRIGGWAFRGLLNLPVIWGD